MTETVLGWWGVPLGVFAGAMRSSTPFLFVSLGELLTEKSGRINLGQEGILVLGAMWTFGCAIFTTSRRHWFLSAVRCSSSLRPTSRTTWTSSRVTSITLAI